MNTTRHYNLDAYRATRDLRDKINSKFGYNNLLLSCYDACILFLKDLYYNMCITPSLNKMNIETLVEALSTRQYKLGERLNGYDRFYHTHYLVYENYIQAKDIDVNVGIECLNNIIIYWVDEVPYNELLHLWSFYVTEREIDKRLTQDTTENRYEIASLLNLYNVPAVDY